MGRLRLQRGLLLGLALTLGIGLPGCDRPAASPCAQPYDDPDHDGLDNQLECLLGTDPNKADSDDDGLLDPYENSYPHACVAAQRGSQRRPAVLCTTDSDCQIEERCLGISPTNPDSDGDGVRDGEEDPTGGAVFDPSSSASDPRLWDSDGDGKSDQEFAGAICRPSMWKMPALVSLSSLRVSLDPQIRPVSPVGNPSQGRAALVFEDSGADLAGLVVLQPTTRASVNDDRLAIEQTLRSTLAGAGALISDVAVGRNRSPQMISSTFRVTHPGTSASTLRNALVGPLSGGSSPSMTAVGSSNDFYLDVSTVRRLNNEVVVLLALSVLTSLDDPSRATAMRVGDVVDGSAIAFAWDLPLPACTGLLSAGGAGSFTLGFGPVISSSLRVAVGSRVVPRSRLDGFDYDHDADTIRFFGSSYRPRSGEAVFASYHRWGVLE